MTAVSRNRTVRSDLAWLTRLVSGLSGTTPARIELSVDGEDPKRPVVAQIMADTTIPVAVRGKDAPAALRALVDECERIHDQRQAAGGRP